MAVGMAGNCFHLSQPSLHRCSSSPQAILASLFSALSAKRRWIFDGLDGSLTCHGPTKLSIRRISKGHSLPRAFSVSLDAPTDNDDDEFKRRIQEINSSARPPPWPATCPEPPKWFDMPSSLRIIKRKKQWEEGSEGESACCSIKRAFSSMVFIVRELQSYTLQMREVLFYENLAQGILARVQAEMNASFVWLFQQVFSCTPTFMVYVMLLLANFTVYSIGGHNSSAIAVVSTSINPPAATVEQLNQQTQRSSKFAASSIMKSFSASVGGNGGGGGKVKPVAGATDDGGSSDAILQKLVLSPVSVELQPEDFAVYSQTELVYRNALSQDPDNVLLLSNFAQFLFLVLHDHDRAEYYFKRAVGKKPAEAEATYKYATFLWVARKDLGAAEAAYVAAVDADPENTHYAASYAHFLWSTGGEDTCYPLNGHDAR